MIALLLASASAGAAHPVFDLVANRTLGHAQRGGGLLLVAGAPGFAKYVHFQRPLPTWRLGAVEDGEKVALAKAEAVLVVPLTTNQAASGAVYLRLKSPVGQTLRVSAGSQSSARVRIAAGWQTVRVALPAGALQAGETRLRLHFTQLGQLAGQKAAAAVQWIQIGGAPEEALPRFSDGKSLLLRRGTGLAWYLQVPAGGALEAHGDPSGCELAMRVSALDRVLLERHLQPQAAPVELVPLGGRIVRLELGADGPGCATARLEASLTAPGPAPAVQSTPRPCNLVFWMTDDTRADRFRFYNPKTRVETPVFDQLGKSSTLFRVAYVQGNESRVSHASLFTSMYAAQHRFIAEKAKLDPKFITLPEAVRPAGLYTAGFIANGFVDAFWGFGEGWDLLRNHIHQGGGLKAEDLVRAARAVLDARSRPFFLYLGTIDAHVSWRAHQPWLGRYDPAPYSGPFIKACLDPQLDRIVAGTLKVTERDKERIRALYDSDVSYNDQQLGRLLDLLAASGHGEDTLLIVTSDHGEELWDHGRIGHGQSLREELVRVPLLIRYPPLFPPGKVVDEGVELIDLLPTLTEAVGQPTPPAAQGESLIALSQGEGQGYPRPAISSQYELAHTMRLGKWKLWVGGSGDTRFYDAAADPGELRELSASHPLERRFVTDALGLWMAYQSRWHKTRWGVASNHKPALANDLER